MQPLHGKSDVNVISINKAESSKVLQALEAIVAIVRHTLFYGNT
jgi:hypothetical protein